MRLVHLHGQRLVDIHLLLHSLLHLVARVAALHALGVALLARRVHLHVLLGHVLLDLDLVVHLQTALHQHLRLHQPDVLERVHLLLLLGGLDLVLLEEQVVLVLVLVVALLVVVRLLHVLLLRLALHLLLRLLLHLLILLLPVLAHTDVVELVLLHHTHRQLLLRQPQSRLHAAQLRHVRVPQLLQFGALLRVNQDVRVEHVVVVVLKPHCPSLEHTVLVHVLQHFYLLAQHTVLHLLCRLLQLRNLYQPLQEVRRQYHRVLEQLPEILRVLYPLHVFF